MSTYALTAHGCFITLLDGRLQQETIVSLHDDDLLDVEFRTATGDLQFLSFISNFRVATNEYHLEISAERRIEVQIHPDLKFCSLSEDGRYYTSIPGQRDLENNRSTIGGWEKFLLVGERDFQALNFIRSNRWVSPAFNEILDGSRIHLSDDALLMIEHKRFRADQNLPLLALSDSSRGVLHKFTLFEEGWMPYDFFLYKPMIFITAYSSQEYIDQALFCINSLRSFGEYRDRIHVITDRKDAFSRLDHGREDDQLLSFQEIYPSDWIGYVASKYCILQHEDAYLHRPLLFLDPDVMADRSVDPMLRDIAMSSKIMAPLENFSSLSTHPSVGATLIQKSGFETRYACGFNFGTIGLPSLHDHGDTLRMIAKPIMNYVNTEGRRSLQWADQEFANFIAFCRPDRFDTHTLLRYVRYGWENIEEKSSGRTGLVHFFPNRGSRSKSEAMRIYTDTLRSALGSDD